MHPRFLLLVLSTACVTSGLNTNVDNVDPTDSDGWVDPNGDNDTGTFDEPCNGLDDDGDGEVDEGYPDTDGDGIADCVDQGCDLFLAEARDVPVDEECGEVAGEVEEPWDVAIEWQWKGMKSNPLVRNVIVAPVIGNLTDTNGDGVVDTLDTPNIAFVAFADSNINTGTLVVLEGDTGEEVWSATSFSGGGGIAMADINGDGQTEIVGFDTLNRVRAVDSEGTLLWSGDTPTVTYPQATVADLDGDGRPEVIADNQVLDGSTGELKFVLDVLLSTPYRLPAVGDLDQDGRQEIILGDRVFSSAGDLLWTSSVLGPYGHWSAILDVDGDPDAEVAMVGAGFLAIHDTDGTELVKTTAGGPQPGAPCVADFDGDGDAEVAWASSNSLNVYDLDGRAIWAAAVRDSSGLAACSGYDIDGDGAYEVLFADEDTFYIFDGRTGEVRFSQGGHASGTLWEYPAVADADNDGSAEIVMASNFFSDDWGGITVFGQVDDAWLKSGSTWHTHDFAVTNILPGGTVPARPEPWWQSYNVYRARPSVDYSGYDLEIAITDVCFSGCEDASAVQLAVQVGNIGFEDVKAGVPISLYGRTEDEFNLIETKVLQVPIPSGRALAAVEFVFPYQDWGRDGVVVRVDDWGSGRGSLVECDERNNVAEYTDGPCVPQ